MPFEVLETISRIANAGGKTSASIGYRRHGEKGKLPVLIVTVPVRLVNGFKHGPDDRFQLHLGSGNDQGKARIVRSPVGVKVKPFKHHLIFRFGYVPMLGTDQAAKEDIEVKFLPPHSFEIKLPPWFKSDEPSST